MYSCCLGQKEKTLTCRTAMIAISTSPTWVYIPYKYPGESFKFNLYESELFRVILKNVLNVVRCKSVKNRSKSIRTKFLIRLTRARIHRIAVRNFIGLVINQFELSKIQNLFSFVRNNLNSLELDSFPKLSPRKSGATVSTVEIIIMDRGFFRPLTQHMDQGGVYSDNQESV